MTTTHGSTEEHIDATMPDAKVTALIHWTPRLRILCKLARHNGTTTTTPATRVNSINNGLLRSKSMCAFRCTTTDWNTNTMHTDTCSVLPAHFYICRISTYLRVAPLSMRNFDMCEVEYDIVGQTKQVGMQDNGLSQIIIYITPIYSYSSSNRYPWVI